MEGDCSDDECGSALRKEIGREISEDCGECRRCKGELECWVIREEADCSSGESGWILVDFVKKSGQCLRDRSFEFGECRFWWGLCKMEELRKRKGIIYF